MKKLTPKKDNPFIKDDWTEESLSTTWDIISELATEKYGLTYYKPHFEVVSFEDMLHIYTGSLPICYSHWSFGKNYIELYKRYMADQMGIAYEVIFNTSPALCYLLEHNSPTMQGLVMSHASIGHSAFFKNNVLFKEQTNAATILPFLTNSKKYIEECENKYGQIEVEHLLDICHSLSLYAIDRMPVREKNNKEKEAIRSSRIANKELEYDSAQESIKLKKGKAVGRTKQPFIREENILKYIGKNSPILKPWQREIINIYCQIQQYLYPQMLTKMMNEGIASFWHHTIMHDLIDQGYIQPGGALEFTHSHCSVLRQPDYDEKGYYGINPYKLGFEMFKDIKRICENPTEEDREFFPDLIGKNWIEQVKFAAYNFKDESFILQYLSPKLIRDFKLFSINDNANERDMEVSEIHDDEGYRQIRKKLAASYNHFANIPDIYIEGADLRKTRTLYLVFQERNGVELALAQDNPTVMTFKYIKELWPFKINIKYKTSDGTVEEFLEDDDK